MLPAAPGRAGGSREWPAGGPAPRENAKDIIMIYEEDAEEWALYLREIFSHVVKREAILLYHLENYFLRDLELLSLNSYKCKLLILSNSLLQNLSSKKCQFLENVLHSPESVVTLLCGMKSSDHLYKLLNISGGRWEISTEQEPEDYISVIKSIIFRGSEDYLDVIIPTDLRVEHSGQISERKEIEELSEASRSTISQAVVLPAEIPCENPGEIFIILRDEVIGDSVEVEFTSNSKCIRTRPALWNKTVWCMKALDFPAGSVSVNVYCDGIIKATAEIKYYSTPKAMKCLLGAAGPEDGVYQNDIDELDHILTSTFKQEIPYYEFRSLQTEIYPQKEYSYFKELPTLLHCAAKFGLKNLAIHLLQCSGATWASKIKNLEGSDPAHIAARHGHKELKKIFEDFSIQEVSRSNEEENDYEEDITSFSTCSPTIQNPVLHPESWRPYRQRAGGAEVNERAEEEKEQESGTEAKHRPPEVDHGSENPYDDLYTFIPGDNPENNSRGPLVSSRPPLPPPRPVTAAFQLEKPYFTLQAGKTLEGQMKRSQSWCDSSARHESAGEPRGEEEQKEDEKEEEEEEDPYTFAEIDDNEYDTILAKRSTKKKLGSRSFIMNRPPAPTPRPTNIPPKEETTPFIAQVFQQKTARRQSDGEKFHGPKKQDRSRMESQAFSTIRDCLASGQEELILLQEKVKNGKLSVDEALEKFKHWQMGKTGLEIIQQEKLRQLRDCIIGKRPEEENVYNKLTIVHHPNGNENAHNENVSYSIPFGNKLPARLQVEKEFGFCCRKDH
ncbi:B-cell scaffold protein with ankyrin repeats isoform X2 [Physeter macrocephalus]|uniref:B-cell scaffold protein with ankyrin repeats n=1 Tax=Physeter macrocephalus TaxID=9755 RepID=A0A455BFH4_PHYMC|nr:B-cell scaffold protein with ankyrin repeats isoform X2 [Physeter catodon]|eukprot:XP_028347492.1 B-cell scaffold protein with ankyrin repeats isoform X2 [Physeter catodon]